MPSPRRRIELELEPEIDPLTGWVRTEGMPAVPFVGWLALIRAIDVLCRDDGRTR